MSSYGKELLLDLRHCPSARMSRQNIYAFMQGACHKMGTEACDFHFWDDAHLPPDEQETDPKRSGISAVQFLMASSIVIHTLDLREEVYVNAFSCDDFDPDIVIAWALECFGGSVVGRRVVTRGIE